MIRDLIQKLGARGQVEMSDWVWIGYFVAMGILTVFAFRNDRDDLRWR